MELTTFMLFNTRASIIIFLRKLLEQLNITHSSLLLEEMLVFAIFFQTLIKNPLSTFAIPDSYKYIPMLNLYVLEKTENLINKNFNFILERKPLSM